MACTIGVMSRCTKMPAKCGGAPQVLAALNNAVISVLGQHGERNVAALQRRFAYQFDRWLARLSS